MDNVMIGPLLDSRTTQFYQLEQAACAFTTAANILSILRICDLNDTAILLSTSEHSGNLFACSRAPHPVFHKEVGHVVRHRAGATRMFAFFRVTQIFAAHTPRDREASVALKQSVKVVGRQYLGTVYKFGPDRNRSLERHELVREFRSPTQERH